MATAVVIGDDELSDIENENEEEDDYPKHKPHNSSHIKSKSQKKMSNGSIPSYTKHKDVSFSTAKPAASTIKVWPNALKEEIIRSLSRVHDEVEGKKFLEKHEWPSGLAQTIFKSCKKIAIRFFIVDDSGKIVYSA
jgi:hypothetical protein